MNKVFKKKTATADGPSVNIHALNSLNNAAPSQLSPGLKKPSTSRWKKGKKQVEVKPKFDLESVLPPSDDFRTSLLMPNLSARFSMLREQDDPHSLIGKASDDSVLQPRRKSRMNEFAYGNRALGDIDEVSSIRGDFVPPFANDRQGSFASEDGYGSDVGGSVMSRARPGEGNILFGGRQKIYRIATTGNGSARSLGKAVYEDDIGVSAFQRYRQRERERDESSFNRTSDESQGFDFGLSHTESGTNDNSLNFLHNDSAKDLSHSPSLSSYDKNRSTTSSVARSEARSSTAATSIASLPAVSPVVSVAPVSSTAPQLQQPSLDRSNTKSRRLYDQGLDQHMRDDQISAMSRLNTFQRQRPQNGKTSPPYLHGAKSTSQLNERAAQPVYALRTQSPTMNGSLPTRGDASKYNSNTPSPVPSSPIDPQLESNQFDLQQALDPADRGKATAIGAFNKPKQAFDEHQYLERQRQLMKSASNTFSKSATPSPATSYHADQHDNAEEKRSEDSSSQTPANAAPKKPENKSYNVFQNAVSQLQERTQGAPTPNRSPLPDTHRTFFGSIHASDSEDDEDSAYGAQQSENGNNGHPARWQPAMPSVSEHPAVRGTRLQSSSEEERDENFQPAPLVTKSSTLSLRRQNTAPSQPDEVESPTLGQESQPLSSMMQHLRSKSNASSMYPADEDHSLDIPRISSSTQSVEERKPSIGKFEFESSHDSTYSGSNPWDLDEADNRSLHINTQVNNAAVSPIEPSSQGLLTDAARQPISPIQSGLTQSSAPFAEQPRKASMAESEDATSWQQELRRQHTRDISSATQQERDAFATELAARRNAIRENIKSIVEKDNHSRDPSPAPASSSGNGPFKAFGMLRTKASGESLAHMREQQLRSAKSTTSINTNLTQAERTGISFDGTRSRGNSSPRPPMPPNSQHPAFQRQPSQDRVNHRGYNGDRSGSRSRSNSTATTGRSRSRPALRRDESDRMADSTTSLHDLSPMIPRELTPKLSADPGASHNDSRFSNDTKSPLGNYFESRSSPTVHTRPPPAFATPNGYNPIRPAPIASVTVPLLSSSSTPVVPAYVPPSSMRSRSNTLRKKTISKADISEPTLLETTANFETVDLPEGASLKNGMTSAPPIPPINPKRRGTRNKLFTGMGGRNDPEEFSAHPYSSPIKTPSGGEESSSQRSQTPDSDFHFPPSNVVRVPSRSALSQPTNSGEYDQNYDRKSGNTPDRGRPAVSADGGMF
ncbi:uncharacterized protein K489DRAFT_261775 [Dissoconium aciculare CBS 342.82]|uniref:Uncharacterized protein n=1 Tax=Dissoconium aciculare CBS 342.82 TaxID=1314786 RepID=A0A6J3LZ85_9PEZI|nr:uncharacterized protein K489DRAFT_261775 [Dissoconium aciculare CBS 342.82]KAF1820973.1 hypothetical protein K489DRAFT_261775 [Dissoconium aciculare CBS 342.82]